MNEQCRLTAAYVLTEIIKTETKDPKVYDAIARMVEKFSLVFDARLGDICTQQTLCNRNKPNWFCADGERKEKTDG